MRYSIGHDVAAHPDAQPVAGADADGTRVDPLGGGDARVPVLGVGEVRDEGERLVDGQAWSRWSPAGGSSRVCLLAGPARGPVCPSLRTRRRSGRVRCAKIGCDRSTRPHRRPRRGARRPQLHPTRLRAPPPPLRLARRRVIPDGRPHRRADRTDLRARARGRRLVRAHGRPPCARRTRRRPPRAHGRASSSPRRPASRLPPWLPTWRTSPRSAPRPREILAREPRLDVIVDNAGTMLADAPSDRRGLRAHLRDDGPRAVRPRLPAPAHASSRAPIRGSSPSPRAGCTRRRCRSTTSCSSRAPIRERSPTRGRSAPRSPSCASGRDDSVTGALPSTRCTRAGPTRPAWPRPCPGSTG